MNKGKCLALATGVAALQCWGGMMSPGRDGADAFRLRDAVVVYEDALRTGSSDAYCDWGFRGAEDLTNGIFRTTGVLPPLYPESRTPDLKGRPVIYVGNTKAARSAGVVTDGLRKEDAHIRVEPNRAFIVGTTGMGVSAGCGRFLETQADYYMMTVSGNDPAVFDPDCCAKVGSAEVRPAIPWRQFHFFTYGRFPQTSRQLIDYGRRVRSLCSHESDGWYSKTTKHCHTFFQYCRPEDFATTHPEYFAMDKSGKRHFRWDDRSQLCFSAPGVFDVVYSNLVRFVEEDLAHSRKEGVPPSSIFEFSQMDCCDHLCWCPDCSKVVARYNRKPGGNWEGGDAALQLLFVNRLARKIRERYPHVQLRILAYVSSEGAPDGIPVEPNVVVRLCDLYTLSDHMRPLESPFNAPRLKLIEDWFRLTKNIEIWDYRLYGGLTWSGMFPEVDVDAIAADTRLFARLGLPRLFQQHHFENQPFFELNSFVESQVMTDPSVDLEKTVERYCRVYGKGAAQMREAIGYLRQIIRENPPANADAWHQRLLPWRTTANMERLEDLVQAAYVRETPGSVAHGRIAEVLASVEMELVRLSLVDRTAGERRKTWRADCERHFREGIVAGAVCAADREREAGQFLGVLRNMGLEFKDLPAELASVRKDDLICVSVSSTYVNRGYNEKDVADPTSELGTVVRWNPREEPKALSCPANGCRLADGQKILGVSPVADGRWQWHRLGIVRITSGGSIAVPQYGPRFRMKDYYTECDGLAEDPNWFEVWVSLKRVGEKYVTKDKKSGLFVDRMILRRVSSEGKSE